MNFFQIAYETSDGGHSINIIVAKDIFAAKEIVREHCVKRNLQIVYFRQIQEWEAMYYAHMGMYMATRYYD